MFSVPGSVLAGVRMAGDSGYLTGMPGGGRGMGSTGGLLDHVPGRKFL